jgi:N-acetylmuramoyl-L-alanine amidase CwlA
MSYTLHKDLKAKSISYGDSRAASSIKYIVFHYTGNKTDTAKANANYFATSNTRAAGAHYFVDDTTVYQSIDDLKIAYAVGGSKVSEGVAAGGGTLYGKCTNANSISIEMCSKNGVITDATIENVVTLAKTLMKKYNVDSDHLCTHFMVT